MNRRVFMGVVTTAAAGALLRCGSGGSGSGPTDADWQALDRGLMGEVILPEGSVYGQARLVFNSRYDDVNPRAIVRCANADDVRETLAFVQRYGLAVHPRGGSHSYGGYSTGTGVVIDTRYMNAVSMDGDTAVVGSGCKLIDVYDKLAASGVSIPAGSCPTVGIAGLAMGGGIGVVDRAYGLTCDRLVGATIVTADGRTLDVDATHEPELFWALRGGGGGNFGIVTELRFRTHPTTDLTTFYAGFTLDDAADVLAAWQAWPEGLPDAIWSQANFWFNEDSGAATFTVWGVAVSSPADLSPHFHRLLAATGREPQYSGTTSLTYRDTMLASAGCSNLSVSQCHYEGQTPDAALTRVAMAASSDFFDAPLPAAGIDALLQAIRTRVTARRHGGVLLDLMGGAIARVAPDATAFVHRGALFSAEYVAQFPEGTSAALVDEGGAWANGMRAAMKPWSSGGAYQNYVDPRITDWPTAYYGANYARLARVKSQYDPQGLFSFPQGISRG
jgi:FAD/FMN-containing dehydrogenase